MQLFAIPGILLEANRGPAVRRQEELKPVGPPEAHVRRAYPHWIFDLGQNMVGQVRLKVQRPGRQHGAHPLRRSAQPRRHACTANLRSARATDTYILKGEGDEI